jgi:hypothetical protein
MHPKIIQYHLVIFVQITLYLEKVRNWPRVTLSERAQGRGHSGASFSLLKFGLLRIPPSDFRPFDFLAYCFSAFRHQILSSNISYI